MVPLEVYKEAMEESLKNAEALIDAAKAVGDHAQKAHALMLHGLSQEEIAKAYACWLVVAKVIPRNHPVVGFNRKKSVFRNHDIKHELVISLGSTLMLAGLKGTKAGESFIPSKGEIFGMGIVANFMGPESTKIRSDSMYVDIRQDEKKSYEVLSPLKLNTKEFNLDFSLSELLIGQIRHLYDVSTTDEFKQDIEKHRSFVRENSPDYPDKPQW